MIEDSKSAIRIDLTDFKLHLRIKRFQLTLHFNSPSRRFYLSVIALVVNEMKKSGKIKSIALQEHINLLALLNESIGCAAGSSIKENLIPRIYRKWKYALPNLEEASLFRVLGRSKEEGDGAIRKVYSFTDTEKDAWANLFDYIGSEENVRLKLAMDKIGVSLDETLIIFGDSANEDAWDQFISSLKTVGSIDRMEYSLPSRPSIAVLPFVNMSEDQDQEFFADGLTEEITTSLSKIRQLVVIARHSAFTYKGKSVKVGQIAEELGVQYVLEGSVRRSGEKIRINAQLVDATKGYHVWAERYDGTMRDVFSVQDQITEKIVSALAVELTGSEKELMSQKGTENVAAYDAFLRGYGHYLRYTAEDSAKAVASFKKALELDPNFGRAFAGLAAIYYSATWKLRLLKGLGVSWHEARAHSLQYLQKATKGPIYYSTTATRYLFRRQYEEAISELKLGLALDPNDPDCLYGMGSVLNFAGRPTDGLEFIKGAIRLDPHNASRYLVELGRGYFCMGELEEAVSLVEKCLRLNTEMITGIDLAAYYALLARDQEARAVAERIKNEKIDSPGAFDLLKYMNSMPFKDPAVAERYAKGLLKAGLPPGDVPGGYFPSFKENQLSGEEITRIFFGSKVTGYYPRQFSQKYKKSGEVTYEETSAIGGSISVVGKWRIEGDTICWQYPKRFGGVEYCATVFRHPGGTYDGKNEYFWCSDFGHSAFSVLG